MLNDISYLCSMDKMSTFRTNLPQVIAVVIINILLISIGMSMGFPTILIAALATSNEFKVGLDDISWLGSLQLICVPVGALASALMAQRYGRKRCMLLINIPFFGTWLLFRFCDQLWQIYLGLTLLGMLHGLAEAPMLSYIAEITTPELRAILSCTSSMSAIIGILIQWVFGTFYPWRHCALLGIIFPMLNFNLLFLVPESPRWLLSKGRVLDTKRSLAWLRGWTSIASIEKEFKELSIELRQNINTSKTSTDAAAFKDYFKKEFLWPFGIMILTFILVHFGGSTNIVTYAIEIFVTFQAPIDEYYTTLILGAANVLGCILCVTLIYYTGKRVLIFGSTFLCAIFAITIACYADYHGINELKIIDHEKLGTNSSSGTNNHQMFDIDGYQISHWIPTGCLLCFSFFTHVGLRLIPWILIGELYSNKTRSVGVGLTVAISYVFAFCSNKSFFILIEWITLPGLFFFYGVLLLVGLVLLYFVLPETEGKSLKDITEHFCGGKKLGNSVNRRKNSHLTDDLWYVNMNFSDSMYYNLDKGDIDSFE